MDRGPKLSVYVLYNGAIFELINSNKLYCKQNLPYSRFFWADGQCSPLDIKGDNTKRRSQIDVTLAVAHQ